ncbi:MAG: endo alpha-1,4 polygalactosaminidase [Acidimicrobiales bacterium]
MHKHRKPVVPRLAALAVIIVAVVVPVTVLPAGATKLATAAVSASGKVTCHYSATVTFLPSLKSSGGGTKASSVKGKLSKCTSTARGITMTSGTVSGSFRRSPLTCKRTLTGVGATLTLVWKGKRNGAAAAFSKTTVKTNKSTGSFPGPAKVTVYKPSTASVRACTSKAGLKDLMMTGLITSGTAVVTPPTTTTTTTSTTAPTSTSSTTTTSTTSTTSTTTTSTTTTSTTSTTTTSTTQPSGSWWTAPPGNLPWQWYLGGTLDLSSPAQMGTDDKLPDGSAAPDPVVYDIDGIENPASTVTALHAMGDHVICYIEVGTAGSYYTAAQEGIATTYYEQLQAAGDLGGQLPGYSEENFVNINAPSAVSIIESMIDQQCAAKGFDAVETDLDETYDDNEGATGFAEFSETQEQTYLTTLADYMHSLHLGWIAKDLDDTDDGFAGVMEPLASGIITEQCNEYGTCGQLTSYEGQKAVFNAEYTSTLYPGFCTYDDANDINGALFDVNLDGPRSPCPGPS